MTNELRTTLVGNLTADPELKFLQSGVAVANFTIAHSDRKWDNGQGKMVDGDTVFMRCTAWRALGENVAESLTKGMRVIAQVVLKQRQHDGKTYTEAIVEAIGPDLLRNVAKVTRANSGQAPAQEYSAPGGSADDPWASGPPASDEPPF